MFKDDEETEFEYVGMTERTYIATAALQGLLSQPTRSTNPSAEAVMHADLLIAELAKAPSAVS